MNRALRLLISLTALLAACSGKDETVDVDAADTDSDTDTDSDSDADTDADSDTDTASDSWDACTEITTAVPELTQVEGTAALPVPAGGDIADGTYVLTAYEVYGASVLTSDTPGVVRAFSAPAFQYLNGANALSGTWSTSGTTLSFTVECNCSRITDTCYDDVQSGSLEYTASGDTLQTFADYINGGTSVSTFTRQ